FCSRCGFHTYEALPHCSPRGHQALSCLHCPLPHAYCVPHTMTNFLLHSVNRKRSSKANHSTLSSSIRAGLRMPDYKKRSVALENASHRATNGLWIKAGEAFIEDYKAGSLQQCAGD